jgi:hypothetical protein
MAGGAADSEHAPLAAPLSEDMGGLSDDELGADVGTEQYDGMAMDEDEEAEQDAALRMQEELKAKRLVRVCCLLCAVCAEEGQGAGTAGCASTQWCTHTFRARADAPVLTPLLPNPCAVCCAAQAEAEDAEYPDEVDTPQDMAARLRFAKFRCGGVG